jgi:LuxR family quorum sensing-dependent transcriptional regulator
MALLNNRSMDLIDCAAGATSAAEVGRGFFAALRPYGIRAIWARSQRTADPDDVVSYSRISPPGWEELYAERRFSDGNFLMRELASRVQAFRWSDVELKTDRDREMMGSLGDFAIDDGIAAPAHAPGGYSGVTSLAFERLGALSPAERRAIGVAGLVLHLQMRELTPRAVFAARPLSPRERDCLGFVAAGLSDWEIGERLGVAETTVISHVQNARRKLGARTRAQAVALALLGGLI